VASHANNLSGSATATFHTFPNFPLTVSIGLCDVVWYIPIKNFPKNAEKQIFAHDGREKLQAFQPWRGA